MKNRQKVLDKLRSEMERLNRLEKDLVEGRNLSSCLSALDFDLFFCKGCGNDEVDDGDCEKCAKEWLEEKENEENNNGCCGVDDSRGINGNGGC